MRKNHEKQSNKSFKTKNPFSLAYTQFAREREKKK